MHICMYTLRLRAAVAIFYMCCTLYTVYCNCMYISYLFDTDTAEITSTVYVYVLVLIFIYSTAHTDAPT